MTDISIKNFTEEAIEYTIVVTHSTDEGSEEVLRDTATLEPTTGSDDIHTNNYEDPMKEDDTYVIDVSTNIGVQKVYRYKSCGENDACGVSITIEEDEIEFAEGVL